MDERLRGVTAVVFGVMAGITPNLQWAHSIVGPCVGAVVASATAAIIGRRHPWLCGILAATLAVVPLAVFIAFHKSVFGAYLDAGVAGPSAASGLALSLTVGSASTVVGAGSVALARRRTKPVSRV